MIIDNKQSYGSNPDIKTVWDCILSYTDPSARVGRMDVVTGFFSIAALHLLYQELSESNSYRMVLGDIHDMKRDEDFHREFNPPAVESNSLRHIFLQANNKYSERSRENKRNVNTLREKLSNENKFFKFNDCECSIVA